MMTWKTVFQNLLGRKMVMFFCSQAAIFYLTLYSKLTGDNFLIVEAAIISAFVLGNAAVHKFQAGSNSFSSNEK